MKFNYQKSKWTNFKTKLIFELDFFCLNGKYYSRRDWVKNTRPRGQKSNKRPVQ